jgi:putative oxidoreductase
MIMLGWRTRIAAIVLMIFTAATTALFHDFWNLTGREQINQMLHAFKNVSMIGGLLILYGGGPGRWSLENRRE